MRAARAAVFAALSVFAACQSASQPRFPRARPAWDASVEAGEWEALRRADAHYFAGEREEALRILEPLVQARPLFVPAARLRQILLHGQGRGGLVAHEAQELVERFPERAEAEYLALRLIPDLHLRDQRIEAAFRRFPESWWVRYSYCWSLSRRRDAVTRDKSYAVELLRLANTPMPWAGGAMLAASLRPSSTSALPFRESLRRALARSPESRGQVELGLFVLGESRWEHVRAGIASAPFSPPADGCLNRVGRNVLQSRRMVALVREDEALRARLLDAGLGGRLVSIAERAGDARAAAMLRSELIRGRRDASLGREGRWILPPRKRLVESALARGDVEEALTLYRDGLPATLLADERNRLAPRLRALLDGPARGLRACPEDPGRARAVLRAMLDAGWVEELRILGPVWTARHPELRPLVEEAERFLRFELGMVELCQAAKGKRRLRDFLAELRVLGAEIYGEDVVGESSVLRFPIIGGRILDPFGPGLPRFFDRYSRHLIFGTLDEPVTRPQIAFGRKIYERRLPVSKDLYVPGRAREVVVEHTAFAMTSNMAFSEPAGVALWNHYVIDLRKWDEWGVELGRMWERMRADPELVLRDPIPAAEPLSMANPAQVHWRLLARAMHESSWSDAELRSAIFELLRLHEHAHLVDAQRFLPAMRNLGAAVQLLARAGFSPSLLMADLEGRAELAALASGADPWLTLGHLAGFGGDAFERDTSPHRVGFARMLRRLLELWHEDGAPGADATRNLLAQLHLLDPERARTYARRVLEQVGF